MAAELAAQGRKFHRFHGNAVWSKYETQVKLIKKLKLLKNPRWDWNFVGEMWNSIGEMKLSPGEVKLQMTRRRNEVASLTE